MGGSIWRDFFGKFMRCWIVLLLVVLPLWGRREERGERVKEKGNG